MRPWSIISIVAEIGFMGQDFMQLLVVSEKIEQAILRCRNAYVERYVEEILAPERLNMQIRLRFEAGHLLEINEAMVVEDGVIALLDYRSAPAAGTPRATTAYLHGKISAHRKNPPASGDADGLKTSSPCGSIPSPFCSRLDPAVVREVTQVEISLEG